MQPKNALIIDGFGALTSAVFLFSLSVFHTYTGLPEHTLRILSVLALAFAIFSFSSYLWSENHRTSLIVIGILNALYCILTGLLVFSNLESMTALGLTYFILEIVVLILLVIFEFSIISASKKIR